MLIPKNKNPSSPLDFQPINLCNVIYKIFSKVLVNRLKPVMSCLVSGTHCAFVHDCSIFDNIPVANEVAHSMKGKRADHVGFVWANLDMSKAYDRIECLLLSGSRINGFLSSTDV